MPMNKINPRLAAIRARMAAARGKKPAMPMPTAGIRNTGPTNVGSPMPTAGIRNTGPENIGSPMPGYKKGGSVRYKKGGSVSCKTY